MKIQDPLTQLLATKLTDKQRALVRQISGRVPPPRVLDAAERIMGDAATRKVKSLNAGYPGNAKLEAAAVKALAADKHRLALWWAKTNAVTKIMNPLHKARAKLLNDARTGKFTPEQLKQAVDAFCKGLGET